MEIAVRCVGLGLEWFGIQLRHWIYLGPDMGSEGLKASVRKNCCRRAERVRHLQAISSDRYSPSDSAALIIMEIHVTHSDLSFDLWPFVPSNMLAMQSINCQIISVSY